MIYFLNHFSFSNHFFFSNNNHYNTAIVCFGNSQNPGFQHISEKLRKIIVGTNPKLKKKNQKMLQIEVLFYLPCSPIE